MIAGFYYRGSLTGSLSTCLEKLISVSTDSPTLVDHRRMILFCWMSLLLVFVMFYPLTIQGALAPRL
jgi:hypothetical protein